MDDFGVLKQVELDVKDVEKNNLFMDDLGVQKQVELDGKNYQQIARKLYSTTSSVYAKHTISNPDAEQILFW